MTRDEIVEWFVDWVIALGLEEDVLEAIEAMFDQGVDDDAPLPIRVCSNPVVLGV